MLFPTGRKYALYIFSALSPRKTIKPRITAWHLMQSKSKRKIYGPCKFQSKDSELFDLVFADVTVPPAKGKPFAFGGFEGGQER